MPIERKMNTMGSDARINIRLTKQEKELIERKANKCKMTITRFILTSCMKDKIVIIDGLYKIDAELRRIGNNINQLTRLANENIIQEVNLKEVRQEVNEIWQLLKQLIQKQT